MKKDKPKKKPKKTLPNESGGIPSQGTNNNSSKPPADVTSQPKGEVPSAQMIHPSNLKKVIPTKTLPKESDGIPSQSTNSNSSKPPAAVTSQPKGEVRSAQVIHPSNMRKVEPTKTLPKESGGIPSQATNISKPSPAVASQLKAKVPSSSVVPKMSQQESEVNRQNKLAQNIISVYITTKTHHIFFTV